MFEVVYMRLGIYGFGSIGRLITKLALERGHEVVGVIDIDEGIIGKDVGELLGLGSLGVRVGRDVLELSDADVVIHATTSYLDRAYNQIKSVIELGISIVSTCETLAFPYYRYPVLALRLDRLARDYGVVVLGTGINPGFIFDTLVVTLATTVPTISKLRVIRSLDVSKRRETLRKKLGVSEDPVVVKRKLESGELSGHVGYAESIYLIALAGDLNITKVVEYQEPIPAEEAIVCGGVRVEKGMCKGVRGYGIGYVGNKDVIKVEFNAYVGAPEYDEIVIEGKEFNVTWRSTGTHGDLGTAAITLNTIERIYQLPPGLHLITELLPFKIRFLI
jgi:4-hydroxy-tetrahydrodipicolinate reductase